MMTTQPVGLKLYSGSEKNLSVVPQGIKDDSGCGMSFTGDCLVYENHFDPKLEEWEEPVFLGTLIKEKNNVYRFEGTGLSDIETVELIDFADNYEEVDYEDYEVVAVIPLRK